MVQVDVVSSKGHPKLQGFTQYAPLSLQIWHQ